MSDRAIQEAIKKLASPGLTDELYFMAATVDSVNEDDHTCAVTSISGDSAVQLPDVKLQAVVADGLLIFPKVDSVVFVAYTKRNEPYVCLFSDIDRVLWNVGETRLELTNDGRVRINDGSFGGITKTQELKAQLDKTNQLLTALLNVINGAPISEPGSGSPSALQTALRSAISGKQLGDYSAIENTKITHG